MHAPICQCTECFARALASPGGIAGGDTTAPPGEVTELGGDLGLAQWDADGQPAADAQVDHTLPALAVGMQIVGAVTIKGGTTHALVLYDALTHDQKLVYWERNAATSGIGEWAVVPFYVGG